MTENTAPNPKKRKPKKPRTEKKLFDKNGKPLRAEQINIRLFPAELLKVEQLAEQHNLPLSTFTRDRILEMPPPVQRVRDLPTIDPELMRKITGAFNNLNQLTRIANSQITAYKQADIVTLHKSLDRLANEIEQLRQQYTAK